MKNAKMTLSVWPPMVLSPGPVQEDGSGLDREFCRIGDLERLFGIRRGTAYGLIKEGKIRSITLRKLGRATGVRLVHVASVRAFLTTLLNEQS